MSFQRTNLMRLLSKCIHKSCNKLNGYKNLPTIGILRVMIDRNVAVHPDRPNSRIAHHPNENPFSQQQWKQTGRM